MGRCYFRTYTVCQQGVTIVHICCIRQKKPKAIAEKYMYVDFETHPTGDVHEPNLVVAHVYIHNVDPTRVTVIMKTLVTLIAETPARTVETS